MFRTTPIVIKGCYNFKLKSVTNALKKNGFIDTSWPDNGVAEGHTAMLKAIDIYKQVDRGTIVGDLNGNSVYKAIIDYNEIDCKAMWDIKRFLKAKYDPE